VGGRRKLRKKEKKKAGVEYSYETSDYAEFICHLVDLA
jgi:hypothetical protein